MTPVHRQSKCVCGKGSKCSSKHCREIRKNEQGGTCKSDYNNFTSYLQQNNAAIANNGGIAVKVLSSTDEATQQSNMKQLSSQDAAYFQITSGSADLQTSTH